MSVIWWAAFAGLVAFSAAIAWNKPRADIAKLIGFALVACVLLFGIDYVSGVSFFDFSTKNRNWKIYILAAIIMGWLVRLVLLDIGME